MNSTVNDIISRRSIRRYKAQQITDAELETVLQAGVCAPTGMNRQSPIIVAVQDKETINQLSRLNAHFMGVDTDPFYGAPVVLVVLAEKGRRTYVHDGSLVMGNLMLAAHALGVGSCWIHRAQETFDQPEWKAFLKSLGLEGDYEGIGNCILGYTDGEEPAAPARREGRVFFAE